MKTNNETSVKTLKERIVKAVENGLHDTFMIYMSCHRNPAYHDFYKAMSELRISGRVTYISWKGYYMA